MFLKVRMKFNRDFINAMDGTGRLLLAFNNVSLKTLMCVCTAQQVFIQIVGTLVSAETWQQCVFTVWWTVQAPEAKDYRRHPANCLLSSARQQSW